MIATKYEFGCNLASSNVLNVRFSHGGRKKSRNTYNEGGAQDYNTEKII